MIVAIIVTIFVTPRPSTRGRHFAIDCLMDHRVLLALGALAVFADGSAHACSCRERGGPKDAFASAKLVFRGKVISIDEGPSTVVPRAIHFAVSSVWKGKVTRSFVIYSGFGGADCGFSFQVGEEYVVYGHHQPYQTFEGRTATNHVVPATTSCDRTAAVRSATDDLEFFATQKAQPLP